MYLIFLSGIGQLLLQLLDLPHNAVQLIIPVGVMQLPERGIRGIFIQLLALGILQLYVLIYITLILTVQRLKNLLLDSLNRLHNIFLRPKRVLHLLAVGADLPLMRIRLRLDLLTLTSVGESFEAISESGMVLLILEELIDKVSDACSKRIVIILAVSIDQDIAMF